jgi:hypothetical protein
MWRVEDHISAPASQDVTETLHELNELRPGTKVVYNAGDNCRLHGTIHGLDVSSIVMRVEKEVCLVTDHQGSLRVQDFLNKDDRLPLLFIQKTTHGTWRAQEEQSMSINKSEASDTGSDNPVLPWIEQWTSVPGRLEWDKQRFITEDHPVLPHLDPGMATTDLLQPKRDLVPVSAELLKLALGERYVRASNVTQQEEAKSKRLQEVDTSTQLRASVKKSEEIGLKLLQLQEERSRRVAYLNEQRADMASRAISRGLGNVLGIHRSPFG